MSNDTSPKPPRWRWAVLGMLVVGALAVPTGIVYLQHSLQVLPHDTARPWDDPIIAQKLSDARLLKANAIRAEWQPWALKHKKELRAMLASQGKDFSRLQAVYKVSPPLTLKDWKPDTRSGPVKFGWFSDLAKVQANGTKLKWADAASEANFEAKKGKTLEWLKTGFAEQSDYMIAVSEGIGPVETQIWASGRVTETRLIDNPDRRKGNRSSIQLPYKELTPPFDFLTSASSG